MKLDRLTDSLSFIDSWLEFRLRRSEIPGLVLSVSHEDKIVFNKAYGYANLEKKQKLTPDHIFRVASHSKTFTATAIMQLAEAGNLRIDDRVVDYLPWLGNHQDSRMSKITIRQILSHSAGLIRDGLNADYWQLERPFPGKAELQHEILETTLVLDPNVQMKYSNFGYGLLGMLIETVSKVPYNHYVQDRIIKPLGLKNTGPDYKPQIANKLVTGYTRPDFGKQRLPIPLNVDTNALSAATGFFATATDLCQYFAAQMVGSKQLLSDNSKREMQRTQWQVNNTKCNEEYGLGYVIEYNEKQRFFGHGGAFPGQSSKTLCNPNQQLVIVLLTNSMEIEVNSIANALLKIVDQFQRIDGISTANEHLRFQGRFVNMWSTKELVPIGDKIFVINSDTWLPFAEAEELTHVNESTLKITKAHGYGSEGELVHFNYDNNGAIESIRYSGMTMQSESVYLKALPKTFSQYQEQSPPTAKAAKQSSSRVRA